MPQFPHFGARYPDDEDGLLTQGGDDPCPFCNTEKYIEFNLDEEAGITKESLLKRI